MFKFLKDKLKSAIGRFSKGAEEEIAEEVEQPEEPTIEEKEPVEEAAGTEPKEKEPIEEAVEAGTEPKEKEPVEETVEAAEEEDSEEIEEPVEDARHQETVEEAVKETASDKGAEEETIVPAARAVETEPKTPAEKEPKASPKTQDPEPNTHYSEPKTHYPEPEKPEPQVIDTKKSEEPLVVEDEIKPSEPKKGFFSRIKDKVTKRSLSEDKFEELFFELEVAMLENNMALEVIEKIKADLKERLCAEKIPIGKTEQVILDTLRQSISSLFDVPGRDIYAEAKQKKPYRVVFLGVNGVGKTTTIAKVAHDLQKQGLKSVMAAADTFRAAAIQQLEEHAKKLNVKIIKHDYGSDPAAVAFDAIKYAESKGTDVVLIDTAGRQHSNSNLMEEMKKIIRIAKPDLKVFVGESITGNDCVDQARAFDEAVGIDGIILTKADVDDKGGAAVSISYVTGKPILYLGMGQDYDSLKPFEAKLVTANLFG